MMDLHIVAGEIVEALSGRGMDGMVTGVALPAPDGCVDINGIELDAMADAANPLGSNQGRAAAHEGIENHIAAAGAVKDRICDHGHRLHRWVQSEKITLLALSPEVGYPGIIPDVGSVTAILAELDIVPVRGLAMLEDKDQLVLAAIERAHAGVALDPDAEVFQFGVNLTARSQQL